MRFILITFSIFIFFSCASYHNPREIKEASYDGLKYESLNRYDEKRLNQISANNDPLTICHKGDFEKANELFKKDLDKKINEYKYWNEISSCYIKHKKYTQARKFLNISLGRAQKNQDKSIILNNIGVIHMENDNFHEAKEYFKKSIQLNSSHLTPKYNLSQIYLKFGLYKKAEENIDFLLKNNPQDVDFLHSKAHLELMLQRHKTALVFFNKIPSQYRTRDDIATNLAMTYFMLGLYKNALKTIDSSDKKDTYYINAQMEMKKKLIQITTKVAGK